MLDEFEEGQLPGDPGWAMQPSDFASYEELYHSASIIFDECTRLESEAGWLAAGLLLMTQDTPPAVE